jgi:hypothetical protein
MLHKLFILSIFLYILSSAALCFGQASDTTQTRPSTGGEVVDLTGEAVRITIEPEKPRVNIIADRIKPEFDMLDLDRSFMQELTGGGEKIILVNPNLYLKDEEIQIEKALNRSR